MRCPTLMELPPAPFGKTGWPWTQESAQLLDAMPDVSVWPRITVVTPSFNQGQFLEETIRSVLLQGYPDLEYIVIDGGSTDGSVDIIKKYDKWIYFWVTEKDSGQADAINKGFRVSSGAIMGWLNSDDCLLPSAVRYIFETFRADKSYDVICGFRRFILGHQRSKNVKAYLKPDKYSLSRNCYIPQETVYWKRAVWEKVGELDESYDYAFDYDFWQRVLAAGYAFYLIPRYTGLFRLHPESKASRLDAVRSKELSQIYKKYLSTTKNEYELYEEISITWRRKMDLMCQLGKTGLLNWPILSQAIVSFLSMKESEIPSRNIQ